MNAQKHASFNVQTFFWFSKLMFEVQITFLFHLQLKKASADQKSLY